MPTLTVEEALAGTDIVINDNGRAAAAESKPVVLSNEDFAVLDGIEGKLDTIITNTDRTADAAEDTTTPVPVIGFLSTVAVTPTVEATPDYSTGDVIGGKNTIAAITRADAKTGYITAVRIYSKADITAQIDCLFFNADPSATTWTENSAVAMNDTDAAKLLGVVPVTQWTDVGTPVIGFNDSCRVPITGNAADDIYMVMVARGTINLASTSDLIVAVTVDQN